MKFLLNYKTNEMPAMLPLHFVRIFEKMFKDIYVFLINNVGL